MHVELLSKPCYSTSVLEALPGKLDIKRLSYSILYLPISTSRTQVESLGKPGDSTSILEDLPVKLDIKSTDLVFSIFQARL